MGRLRWVPVVLDDPIVVDGRNYFFSVALANKTRKLYDAEMDESRKRVIGIMAAILASQNIQSTDDLFGGPQGSPRTNKLIAASIQWAEKIMAKIDDRCGK